MNRNRMVWYAAALSALVAAACFSDPTSSLRNGPSKLELSRNAITVRNGDSIAVTGTLLDAQGNPLPTDGATWTSADPAIARVTVDTVKPAPGQIFTRAFVTGVTNVPGITTVTVTVGGVTDSTRVTVLPSTFPGTAVVSGTAGADTVTLTAPPPQGAPWTCTPTLCTQLLTFTAGDTLTLTAPAGMTFNTNTAVNLGAQTAMIFSNTGTVIKALARQAYGGKVTVTNMTFAGNTATGPIAIASLTTDSITIEHARFRGTAVSSANAVFGAGTNIITITAGNAALTFDSLSGAILGPGASPSTLTRTLINTSARTSTGTMILVDRTAADTVKGNILLTNVLVNGGRVDSLRLGPTPAVIGPLAQTTLFPGTVSILGTGRFLDTIVVKGNGLANFTATSTVTVNGVTAFIVSQTADSLRAIAKISGTATPTVSFRLGQTAVTNLAAQSGALAVSSTTGEANEPGNDASATATTITLNGATPVVTFGALNDASDATDFYKFTTAAAGPLTVNLQFTGNSGGTANNPNIQMTLCADAACTVATNTAATGTQPKTISFTGTTLAAGTYYIRLTTPAGGTGGLTYTYRLSVNQ